MKRSIVMLLCFALSAMILAVYGISSLAVKAFHIETNWLKIDYFYMIALPYLFISIVLIFIYIYKAGKAVNKTYLDLKPEEKRSVNNFIIKSIKIVGKFVFKSLKTRKDKVGAFARHVEANIR